MLLRRLADFILRSRLHATATAFLCVYISMAVGGLFALLLVGIIGIVIAAFVTLRRGTLDGILVTAAATLPYFLMYRTGYAENHFWIIGILIAVAGNGLTLLFAIILRKYETWSFILDSALMMGIVTVGIIHSIYPTIADWWATQIITYSKKNLETLASLQTQVQGTSQDYLAALSEGIGMIKPFLTGFLVASILLGALMPVLLARWWQAVVFNPGGLRKELYQIRLSYFAGFIFIVGVTFAYFGNATALDSMPVLFGIYSLAGLSLLHAVLGMTPLSWLWLTLIYLGLLFVPFVLIIIACLGLLDTGIDFRQRLHKF